MRAGAAGLQAINRFVVLMLENRSFDHILGTRKALDPAIDGPAANALNYVDPCGRLQPKPVRSPSPTALAFDPPHEFDDVKEQVNGPAACPSPMSGFASTASRVQGGDPQQVMECFDPPQLPVLSALAAEFATFNYWYSPMPGSTWPNRFFVHAGTSGGLSESPGNLAILNGFVFRNGTLYENLDAAGKSWRIYHEDMPQALGVWWLRSKYLSSHFRKMPKFFRDVSAGRLPDYTFIEPRYDVFGDFVDGNSMHPHNDVARGEKLVKDVYEAIRNSSLWQDTMLIITFDEHGGFYDHVSPPAALPTGDDATYASAPPFPFDRYGVRVPALVVSAYTDPAVIGSDPTEPATIFDHCSIPATVRKRYRLGPLSNRERSANTLDAALNRGSARSDAPTRLPAVRATRAVRPAIRRAPETAQQLTRQQEAFLALAAAMDAHMNPTRAPVAARAAALPRTPQEAGRYAARVQAQALARRGEAPLGKRAAPKRGKPKRAKPRSRKRSRR
ncbi:MAG: phospholipase [Betaproteobacteria bacterium]|nr:phospholipase [Betaproteobacteria bacterium]